MQTKVVITGGPGTGKSTIIDELISRGFSCMQEISREITLNARANGTEQLFLTQPLLFSELLLNGRESQFVETIKLNDDLVFFDRGIPDIPAYMNYIGIDYPKIYMEKSALHSYDYVFLMPPWEDIYISDNERYESFEQALAIHNHLERTYKELNYNIQEVPPGSVNDRTNFILDCLKNG